MTTFLLCVEVLHALDSVCRMCTLMLRKIIILKRKVPKSVKSVMIAFVASGLMTELIEPCLFARRHGVSEPNGARPIAGKILFSIFYLQQHLLALKQKNTGSIYCTVHGPYKKVDLSHRKSRQMNVTLATTMWVLQGTCRCAQWLRRLCCRSTCIMLCSINDSCSRLTAVQKAQTNQRYADIQKVLAHAESWRVSAVFTAHGHTV